MTEISSPPVEQEIVYQRATLVQGGESITLNGRDILNTTHRIWLTVGFSPTGQRGGNFTLHYEDTSFDSNGEKKPHWVLIDTYDRSLSWNVSYGIPFELGRANRTLYAAATAGKKERELYISGMHAFILAAGDFVTVVQRTTKKPPSPTVVDFPPSSFFQIDLTPRQRQ